MPGRWLWLAVLLSLPLRAVTVYHQDFSDGQRGRASLHPYQDHCRFELDPDIWRSAPASLAITTDTAGRGGADLPVAVEPGHTITVRWSYRGDGRVAPDAAMVRFGLYDLGRRRMAWPAGADPVMSRSGVVDIRPSDMTINVALLPAQMDWQTVEVQLRLPQQAGWLLINLCAFHGGGTIYYDEVEVIDPNPSAALPDLPRWTAPWPDVGRPAAGYAPLAGVKETIVYRGKPGHAFNHIPRLCHHDGMLFVAWNDHPRDEDAMGQRILVSRSADGLHWSAAEEWLPPVADRFLTVLPMRFPDAWQVLDGRLYLVASTFASGGARGYRGEVARGLKSDDTLGSVELLDDPDHPLLALRGSWAPSPTPDPSCVTWYAADGNRLIEREVYRRPDGVLVALARQAGPVFLLYAALSRDDGRSWSDFQRTDIPDSPSLTASGTLPDGRVFLIHSPVAMLRDPLVLSLSADGITFDQAVALRYGTPPVRYEGRNKLPGFQYPSAVVVGDSLWVAYAIGKEDIAVARVPLAALPKPLE